MDIFYKHNAGSKAKTTDTDMTTPFTINVSNGVSQEESIRDVAIPALEGGEFDQRMNDMQENVSMDGGKSDMVQSENTQMSGTVASLMR